MQRTCGGCGRSFKAVRANAKYCGDACRQRGHRRPGEVVVLPGGKPPADATGPGPLEASCSAKLIEVGRTDSELGAAALFLAHRLDLVGLLETGAGVAALMKEYRATLAEAIKDADRGDDPLEQIHAAAALKLIRGGKSA